MNGTAELRARTLFVAAALLPMTAAFVVAKTGRDALYFQGQGLYDLPNAYIGIAGFAVPFAFGMLELMRRFGPRRARLIAPVAMALALCAYWALARPGGGLTMTAFFMLVPLAFGVLFSVTWLLASDLLEGAARAEQARAYSVVGAASILGGVCGGLIARALAERLEPRSFLLLGALGLGISAALIAWAQARYPPPLRFVPQPRAATPGVRAVLGARYSMLLLAVGMLGSLVGVLIEFQLYLAAATSGYDGKENARFFASIYLLLNVAALLLQLLLMPLLQRWIGVHGSLLVLPAALFSGAVGLLGGGSLFSRSLLRVTEGGLKASIHRANWEQAYLPLAGAVRPAAKVWVDGAAARVAEGVAALLLFLWLHFVVRGGSLVGRDASWLVYVLLGASVLWVLLTLSLRGVLQDAGGLELRLDVPLPET